MTYQKELYLDVVVACFGAKRQEQSLEKMERGRTVKSEAINF